MIKVSLLDLDKDELTISLSIALSGQSGIGKTSMAIEYAYRYAPEYPGGVFFLFAERGVAQAARNLFERMEKYDGIGKKIWPKQEDKEVALAFINFINQQEKSLVIFDNITDASFLNELSFQNSHVLATTQLTDLLMPAIKMANLPDDAEAFDIFLSYANLKENVLLESEIKAAKSICQRVENLPLGLEIMGKIAFAQGIVNLSESIDDITKRKAYTLYKGLTSIEVALSLAKKRYEHPKAHQVLLCLGYFDPDEIKPALLAEFMQIEKNVAMEALYALAKLSVIKSKTEGGFTIHRLTQEAVRELDGGNYIGLSLTKWMVDKAKEALKSGYTKRAYGLIPHMIHISSLSRADQDLEAFPPEDHVFEIALYLNECDWLAQAEKFILVCLERVKKSEGEDNKELAQRMGRLAMVYWYKGDYEKAAQWTNDGLKIADKSIGPYHQEYARLLDYLALTYKNQKKHSEAEKIYEQIFEIDKKTIGLEHREHAKHLNNLAVVLREQGKYNEAEKLLIRAIKITEKIRGPDDLKIAYHYSNLAMTLHGLGRYSESDELFKRELRILENTKGKQGVVYSIHLARWAGALEEQKRHFEAERLYKEALQIFENFADLDHPEYLKQLEGLLRVLMAQEKKSDVKEILRHVFELCLDALGPNHPQTNLIKEKLENQDK